MANNWFRFKQFTVLQEKSAMRVGTDGVLLGAWAAVANAKTALDIGTGTGLIALMLAQRAPTAQITGIEIEQNAATEAQLNVRNSPWPERVSVKHTGLTEFAHNCTEKFDCIVCNPPFFENSLKAATVTRTTARHNTHLSYELLFRKASGLLAPKGCFAVIVPTQFLDKMKVLATGQKMHLHRLCFAHSLPGKESKRILANFGFTENRLVTEKLTIRDEKNNYTNEMRLLTGEFYLD